MRTDLDHARRASAIVNGVTDGSAEFATRARDLPTMLRRNGLAATTASIAAAVHKGRSAALKEAYRRTYDALAAAARPIRPTIEVGDDLLAWLTSTDIDEAEYRLVGHECAALALWIKRLAEARWGSAG